MRWMASRVGEFSGAETILVYFDGFGIDFVAVSQLLQSPYNLMKADLGLLGSSPWVKTLH
jgi:hypothetical protein